MGTVPVEIAVVGRDRGYPIEQLTVYVYCDACGSFRVRSYPSGKVSEWAAKAGLVAGGLFVLLKDRFQPGAWIVFWTAFFVALAFASWANRHAFGHVCHDCGNKQFRETNSLNYPEYDPGALPVSEKRIHAHYFVR